MTAAAFHADELAAQRLAGEAPAGAGIREFMTEQHREFFANLPYVFVAVPDETGWPWATMLDGPRGFVRAPDPTRLTIAASPGPDDPASDGWRAGNEIGLLGLDFATRRRNRENGRIVTADAAGAVIAVEQSFGNCPRYIQRREAVRVARDFGKAEKLDALDDAGRDLIGRADTFFIASRSRAGVEGPGGVDISHRGGPPGFVGESDGRLVVPDFPGNRYYNTLGNLLGDPRAGLLFLDLDSGEVLQLQGRAEIDWRPDAARSWRFEVERGWRRPAAAPFAWMSEPTTARDR